MRQLILRLAPQLERLEGYRPVGFGLAGIAIGLAAWTSNLTGVAGLFPALWLFSRNRHEAGWLAFCYYLSGSWVIPGASAAFFGTDNSANLGLVIWASSAAVLTVPWTLVPRSMVGLLVALVAVSVPPIGLIGWLNPLLAAADLFPGAGFLGLAGELILLAAVAGKPAAKKWRGAIAMSAVTGSLICHFTYAPRPVPAQWLAIDTQYGKTPTQLLEKAQRQIEVIAEARRALNTGAQLVLLPESVTGWFDDGMLSVWQRELAHYPWRERQMLLVGAERPIPSDRKAYRNSLAAWIQGDFLGYVSARQTVPVSMWKPWAKDEAHAPAEWFKLNLMPVPLGHENKMVAAVFCYEEFLIFPLLSTLAIDSPYAILSVVNGWWASPDDQRLQRQHVEAWARLFNLPLLRAVNR